MTELNILLVEDDELLRKSVFKLLKDGGHRVKGCDCLADARKAVKQTSFHLAFLDMRLPDGNGLDFYKEIEEACPGIKIVIVTAFSDVRTAVAAIKLGAYDYLPKPFEHAQLEKIVRNVAQNVDLSTQVSSLSRLTSNTQGNVWQLDNMIGTDSMRDIFERAQKVADVAKTTVLILGETGTGKGMLSKAIHRLSQRVDKPFVEINCSAIPEQLLESELFGHEKGAFTDAKAAKLGLLEIANGGTVFLDEIGDMAINLQSKLLKVIEDKEFRRVGSGRTTTVDIRIIAATSRNLQQRVKDGLFREDLYYRLSVIPIVLPPLREHRSSVRPLAEHYLEKASREGGRTFDGIDKDAMDALLAYSWPGNVRELRNVLDRSVILESSSTITRGSLGLSCGEETPAAESQSNTATVFSPMTLADSERDLIGKTLAHESGNKNKAAALLGIHRTTLYKKIDEYGLEG